jgi:hypothetical protein
VYVRPGDKSELLFFLLYLFSSCGDKILVCDVEPSQTPNRTNHALVTYASDSEFIMSHLNQLNS